MEGEAEQESKKKARYSPNQHERVPQEWDGG